MRLTALLAAAAIVASSVAARAEDTLHIYNWTGYTSLPMLKDFTDKTGIKVTLDTAAAAVTTSLSHRLISFRSSYRRVSYRRSTFPSCPATRTSTKSGRTRPGIQATFIPFHGSGE